MDDQRAGPRLTRGAGVAIAIVAIVAIGGVVFGALGGPRLIDAASLGCEAGDEATAQHPPQGSFGPADPVASGFAWATDAVLEDRPMFGGLVDVDSDGESAVAVGRIEPEAGVSLPLIATTRDGRQWILADVPHLGEHDGDIVDVQAGGPGWVAVGSVSLDDRGSRAGAIWWSANGRTWARVANQPVAEIYGLAVGDRGLMALGSGGSETRTLGSSRDGITWTWRDPMIRNGGFGAIAWATDEWVAAGSIGLGGSDMVPAIWRSPDGMTWSCRLLPSRPDTPFGTATGVLPGANTTLVTGQLSGHCASTTSCAAFSAAWIPTEDGGWAIVEPGQARPGPMTMAPGGTFLTIDADGVWHSVDGIRWNLVADAEPVGGTEALTVLGSEIVTVGSTWGAGRRAWVGLLESTPAGSP